MMFVIIIIGIILVYIQLLNYAHICFIVSRDFLYHVCGRNMNIHNQTA